MKNLFVLLSALAIAPVYAAEAVPSQSAPSPAPTTQTAAPAKPAGSVARAQFTSAVQDREPTDKVTNLTNDKTQIYFFSEIKDAANHKITHRWEHDGKVMSEVSFDVGSDRWRVFSSKTLDPSWTGEWKVSVVDETGGTLGASTFSYEAPKATAPASAPTQPAAPAAPAAPSSMNTR
jgi:hypothetical protein